MKGMWWAVAIIAVGFAGESSAAIYKCKNEKGEIYYAQSFDPKRCGGGGAQLNDRGMAVRQIERRKTPEELAAEKAEAEKAAELKRVEDAQRQSDLVLMQSYANEQDLIRTHDQEVEMILSSIATAKLQLVNQQKTLSEFLGNAAEAERAGKAVPEAVAKNIATVRQQIEEQNAFIARREAERATSDAAFAEKLERYRLLKDRQARH